MSDVGDLFKEDLAILGHYFIGKGIIMQHGISAFILFVSGFLRYGRFHIQNG